MKIAVCIKQTIDTEALVTVNSEGQIATEGAVQIIDPYAEFAVERAIQLKEEHDGEVVLVIISKDDCAISVKQALSMGADSAVIVCDDGIDETNPQAKARVLAAVLKDISPDLIMGGCKSGDTAQAQTMPRVAEIMGLPQVNLVVALEVNDQGILVSHELDNGVEKIQLPLPAVICAQQGLAEPRYPTAIEIMRSNKKFQASDTKTLADIAVDPTCVGQSAAKVLIQSYSLKEERSGGRIVPGDASEAVPETVSLLSTEAKIL